MMAGIASNALDSVEETADTFVLYRIAAPTAVSRARNDHPRSANSCIRR